MQIQQQQNNIPGHMRTPDLWCNIEQCVCDRGCCFKKAFIQKKTCSIFDFPSSLERVKKKWRISAHALTNEKVTPSSFFVCLARKQDIWNETQPLKTHNAMWECFIAFLFLPLRKKKKQKQQQSIPYHSMRNVIRPLWLRVVLCVCVSECVWMCATERPICCLFAVVVWAMPCSCSLFHFLLHAHGRGCVGIVQEFYATNSSIRTSQA